MLEVILDTETTGLSTKEKHKIVEIGCVELKRKKSRFVVRNNFRNNSTKKNVKRVLRKILLNA